MTAGELANQIMALPIAERAAIAQKVWESIEDESLAISSEADAEAILVARQRDESMSRGDISGLSHQEAIVNARRAVECE
jgi:hypothetical protein